MYVASYHSRLKNKLSKCMPRPLKGPRFGRKEPAFKSASRANHAISPGLREKSCLSLAVALGAYALLGDAHAAGVNGDLFNTEIGQVEKLITGGYMRVGLLAVSGAAAIGGILKQNGWMFASGIAGCAFVYFMKGWITSTFAMVV